MSKEPKDPKDRGGPHREATPEGSKDPPAVESETATAPPPANEFQQSAEQWFAQFLAEGTAAAGGTTRVPKGGAVDVQTLKATVELLSTPPESKDRPTWERVIPRLANHGIDSAYCTAGMQLVQAYIDAGGKTLETTGIETLTPAERKQVLSGGQLFEAIAESIRDVKTKGVRGIATEIRALVGSPGNIGNAPGLQAALKKLSDAASTRQSVLTRAGVTQKKMDQVREYATSLEAVGGKKPVRVKARQTKSTDVASTVYSMRNWVDMHRARSRMALFDEKTGLDEQGFTFVTSTLPPRTRAAQAHHLDRQGWRRRWWWSDPTRRRHASDRRHPSDRRQPSVRRHPSDWRREVIEPPPRITLEALSRVVRAPSPTLPRQERGRGRKRSPSRTQR